MPFLIPRFIRCANAVLVFFAALALAGCQSVSYYSQSVAGHTTLMMARVPVDKALSNVSPEIADKLRLSKSLLSFAEHSLGLPSEGSYTTYVQLNREFPVWVVVAAPEKELRAKQWCYFVIGCAAYRGYFSKAKAQAYAKRLRQQGWHTYVGGASAYSTLGWFSDPLLPSMMRSGDAVFAEVIFHELAHQALYVSGDSAFNEAFATFVGELSATKYLSENQPELLDDYQRQVVATREFSKLVESLKQSISAVYQSKQSRQDTERAKLEHIARFRNSYAKIKREHWRGRGYFDGWVSQELNNAQLVSYSTYRALLPKFSELYQHCGSNLSRFIEELKRLKQAALDGRCQS